MKPDLRKRDLVKCEDMRLYSREAVEFIGLKSSEDFLADRMLQAAVIRCIEIVGEAARCVSQETRQAAPGIPWPLIVGMRHILAHDYGAVNLDRVYSIAKNDLPELIARIEPLIADLERETDWRETEATDAP